MNRKDTCSCKFCMPKCQKYVKNNITRHVCFDENYINKPDSRCFKLQVRKRKFAKKSTIRNKIKGFKNRNAAKFHTFRNNIFNENINKKYFVDTLNNFFILPKEEVSNIWWGRDPEHKYENEKISEEHTEINTNENISDGLFTEVTGQVSRSILILPKAVLKIPNTTQKYFNRRKMSIYEQVKKLVHKDLPLYKIKIASKKINRTSCKTEFIAQWFKHGYEHTYESLESFSCVFKDIDELETTKKFCSWLRKHPEIEPPPYLLKHGLLEQNKSDQTSSECSQSYNKNGSSLSFEINDDYINNHFKQFAYQSVKLSHTDSQSIDNRFISDIDIIV